MIVSDGDMPLIQSFFITESNRNSDSISICYISDNQLFYRWLFCMPYSAVISTFAGYVWVDYCRNY